MFSFYDASFYSASVYAGRSICAKTFDSDISRYGEAVEPYRVTPCGSPVLCIPYAKVRSVVCSYSDLPVAIRRIYDVDIAASQ